MKVIISKDAADYLRRERAYIAEHDPRAAESVMRQIQAAIQTLGAYPNAGVAALPLQGRRRFVVAPCVIDYSIMEHAVHIVAVRHGRQNDTSMEIDGDDDFEAGGE
jgi:plasmid stabilization system protein ParE